MTAPVRIPHVSSGNLLLDVSQAGASLAQGMQQESTRRREEAMRQAMLKLQQGQLDSVNQYRSGENRRMQLDDLRSRGIDIDPSQPGVQLAGDLTPVIAEAERVQHSISQDPKSPGAPQTININGVAATVRPFYDPQGVRLRAAEEAARVSQQRADMYEQGRNNRQQRMLREPSPEENSRGGATVRALHAQKTLLGLEKADATVANRSGLIEFFSKAAPTMQGEAAFRTLITNLASDPAAQQYAVAMRNFISPIAQASIGKAWTVAELGTLLPGFFSFGFAGPETLKLLQDSRSEAIRSALVSTGPGLMPLIEAGYLQPEDIPEFDRWLPYWQRQYGWEYSGPPRSQTGVPQGDMRNPQYNY